MMSAKIATLGFVKIRTFWYKGYDVIIYSHYVTNNFLLYDSNYIIDVVMWPKFSNCIISMRKVIITSIFLKITKIWLEKSFYFWGMVLVQVQWFRTGTRYELEILHYCGKRIKSKSQKVFGTSYKKLQGKNW